VRRKAVHGTEDGRPAEHHAADAALRGRDEMPCGMCAAAASARAGCALGTKAGPADECYLRCISETVPTARADAAREVLLAVLVLILPESLARSEDRSSSAPQVLISWYRELSRVCLQDNYCTPCGLHHGAFLVQTSADRWWLLTLYREEEPQFSAANWINVWVWWLENPQGCDRHWAQHYDITPPVRLRMARSINIRNTRCIWTFKARARSQHVVPAHADGRAVGSDIPVL
jgi:hypothetical protein